MEHQEVELACFLSCKYISSSHGCTCDLGSLEMVVEQDNLNKAAKASYGWLEDSRLLVWLARGF